MENKKQDVKSLEDLLKAANDFRKWAIDFGNELSKILADIQTSKKEEDTWEMKCPYKNGDEYYLLKSFGDFQKMEWTNHLFDELALIQGNIFTNEEAVNLEVKRRNLLTRFRAFRDECNVDWKPDWESNNDRKHYILFSSKGELETYSTGVCNDFQLFGFFKNKEDAERAIELFGDEIKELFVEKRLANENN